MLTAVPMRRTPTTREHRRSTLRLRQNHGDSLATPPHDPDFPAGHRLLVTRGDPLRLRVSPPHLEASLTHRAERPMSGRSGGAIPGCVPLAGTRDE